MGYDDLVNELGEQGIDVVEFRFKGQSKGYYSDKTIAINSNIETSTEKCCTLIEEVGHVKKSSGNILNNKDIESIKQEKIARRWGYETLISLSDLINASIAGVQGRYELAKYLDVTEQFLEEAIDEFKEKYGIYTTVGKYIIYFSPCLGVMEKDKLKL